jgi:hypothetical protein
MWEDAQEEARVAFTRQLRAELRDERFRADDLGCAFRFRSEAKRLYQALPQRRGTFPREVARRRPASGTSVAFIQA